jgi:hypothetical protein
VTIYRIPLASREPHQVQTTTLDGRAFRLSVDWNGRIERWFFSLHDAAGTALVTSKALVGGADLLRQLRWNPEAPQGGLILIDTLDEGTDADLDSLGVRHVLMYVSPE